jgi:hypothetical protein
VNPITPTQIAACRTLYELEVLLQRVGSADPQEARAMYMAWCNAGSPTWLQYHPAPGRASRRHPPRTPRKPGAR